MGSDWSIVMVLLRTMKEDLNCFVQSGSGVVNLSYWNKGQVSGD
jgi:hypothetical protein